MSLENNYKKKPNNYFNEYRDDLISYFPKNAKSVLDVGCSSGEFGHKLKNKYKDVFICGIEPNEEAAKSAKKKLDHVICSTFDDGVKEFENKIFDCICFNDVLEHLLNPSDVLQKCKSLLNPNGVIMASIPNVLFFPVMYNLIYREDWKYEKSGVLDDTHLKFFTPKSMVRLFETNGYRIIKIEGINAKIHSSYKLYKLLNFILFNKLRNWKYMQFVIIASKKNANENSRPD